MFTQSSQIDIACTPVELFRVGPTAKNPHGLLPAPQISSQKSIPDGPGSRYSVADLRLLS